MRQALRSIGTPDHVGLAYDVWAPVGGDGKVPDKERAGWLARLAEIAAPPDYSQRFERWETSFSAAGDRVFKLELASRLLIGHGNASGTGVGLTVHRTWGVPVIPGSALKGLTAHYVDAVYGPSDPERKPWEQDGDAGTRASYQGVTWHGTRILRGPGADYRALFGAPDAEEDDAMRERGFEAGASAGLVIFHDALYAPKSVEGDRPFAADVITVHQKTYYDKGLEWAQWRQRRRGPEPEVPSPHDYDSVNLIAFLTVRPGAQFLFALSGPPDCTALAEQLLREALEKWGVGGKTSAGYGRLISPGRSTDGRAREGATQTPHGQPVPRPGNSVEAVLLEERTRKGGWKARHEPSGLEGPIQNSGAVPADKKPGERVSLIVKIAKGRESGFEWPVQKTVARSDNKQKKR